MNRPATNQQMNTITIQGLRKMERANYIEVSSCPLDVVGKSFLGTEFGQDPSVAGRALSL